MSASQKHKISDSLAGEGGQLRLSHLTPATPSAGLRFGSDHEILGVQTPGVIDVRSVHRAPWWVVEEGPLGKVGAPRTVLSIAVSATPITRSTLSKSTLSLSPCPSSPTCSSFCGAAMRAPFGSEYSPGFGGSLKNHHRFTVIFDGACRFCRDCWYIPFMKVDSLRSIRVLLSEIVILLPAMVFSTPSHHQLIWTPSHHQLIWTHLVNWVGVPIM